jgi:hypothetical protein
MDYDADMIEDWWEFNFWETTNVANETSNSDNDPDSDLDEFINGTNPLLSYLTGIPEITVVTNTTPSKRIKLTVPTENMVSYRLQRASPVQPQNFQDVLFANSPGGTINQAVLIGNGTNLTIEVDGATDSNAVFRLSVRE